MTRQGMVTRTLSFAVQRGTNGADDDTAEIIISSGSVDRDNEIVEPEGGSWSDWLKTGASVLFGHRYDALPVAKGIRIWLDPVLRQWHAVFRWVQGDEFADRVKNVYKQGLLAASIGFIPDEFEALAGGGRRYTKWRGVEFSLVPVPSNVDAIAVTRALGLPVQGEDDIVLVLDDEPAVNAGARHNATDRKLIQRIHQDSCALGAACRDATPTDEPPDDQIALSIDDSFATELALARRRRSEPFGDPSGRRRHVAGELIEVTEDDVRDLLRESLAAIFGREALKEIVDAAMRRLAGKVD